MLSFSPLFQFVGKAQQQNFTLYFEHNFAAFEKHVGFYPTPSGIEQFKDDLSAYHSAKGSVQFPLDAPIPYALIKKIVKFRVKENRDKLAAKAKPKPRKKNAR